MCIYVFVRVEEKRDYNSGSSRSNSWRVAEDGERNDKRNLQALNKRMESQKGTWQSCDWSVLLRLLSLAL